MKFGRLFKYVIPQWPRLVVVIFAAFTVAVLFSASFATIIPLLKVMMGEEGLHGWIDRKTVNYRYGMDFYVPSTSDFLDKNTDSSIKYYLLVTNVEEGSKAESAGIAVQDRILQISSGAGLADVNNTSSLMLETLAKASGGLSLSVIRPTDTGGSKEVKINLPAKKAPGFYNSIQGLIKFVPRGQGPEQKRKAVVFIILFIGVITLLRCAATFVHAYTAEKIVQNTGAELRQQVLAHAMVLPIGFFSKAGTSDTTSRMVNDINAISKGLKILLGKAIREPLKALGTLIVAFIVSWQLTLIFLALAPFTIGLGALLGKKIKKAMRRTLESSALILARLSNIMQALKVVKVYNRQDYEVENFSIVNRRYLRRMLRVAKIEAATGPIMEILGLIAGSAALLVGVHWVTSNNMDASSFFGLLVFLGATAESVRKSCDIWNKVMQSNAAAERVFAVMEQPGEHESAQAVKLDTVRDSIEFCDVHFTYPGNTEKTLAGINLKVSAGATVAVVGPNGSGKTTLVNLLPRFYDPDKGKICFDGVDIKTASHKSVRDQIAMVTQQVVTFNDTIASNIAYGRKNATMDEIIAAAKSAFAHEFIEKLPDGYETVIGEHSSGLSGGQLQRIVIARAVLKNPAILIFDEAMSQIDADSEAKIHEAIDMLTKDRTCFVIAHRFSTVVSADLTVVVEAGKIIAQGKHEQLMQQCPLYQSLYQRQLISG